MAISKNHQPSTRERISVQPQNTRPTLSSVLSPAKAISGASEEGENKTNPECKERDYFLPDPIGKQLKPCAESNADPLVNSSYCNLNTVVAPVEWFHSCFVAWEPQ